MVLRILNTTRIIAQSFATEIGYSTKYKRDTRIVVYTKSVIYGIQINNKYVEKT